MTCPASGVEYGTAKRYVQSSGLLTLKGCCELPDCEALPSQPTPLVKQTNKQNLPKADQLFVAEPETGFLFV